MFEMQELYINISWITYTNGLSKLNSNTADAISYPQTIILKIDIWQAVVGDSFVWSLFTIHLKLLLQLFTYIYTLHLVDKMQTQSTDIWHNNNIMKIWMNSITPAIFINSCWSM